MTYYGDTQKRSLIKAISWRAIAFIVLGIISWIVTRNWDQTARITIVYSAVQIVLYYFHERWWESSEWGRKKTSDDYTI